MESAGFPTATRSTADCEWRPSTSWRNRSRPAAQGETGSRIPVTGQANSQPIESIDADAALTSTTPACSRAMARSAALTQRNAAHSLRRCL